jgi:DNA-directed RNA polymerase subunit F
MTENLSETMQEAKNTIESFTGKATDTVANEAKNAFDKLETLAGAAGQALKNLMNNLTKTVSDLNEATTKIKTSVLEATNGAIKTLSEASDHAASVVKETTDKATGALNDATNISVHRINDATTSIAEVADKTKLTLEATLERAEQLSGAIANSVQEVVITSVQMWMVEHPAISWIVMHPLLSIILILLMLLVFWNLLNASIKFAQQIFLLILKAQLISVFNFFQSTKGNQSNNSDTQERLPNILNRLEELRYEQDTLMREMNTILISRK